MKLNLVNVLATVLILGGVVLLVQRKTARGPAQVPLNSIEAAKKDAVVRIEKQLGRPLNEAELQMIDGQISITLRQPLAGRYAESVAASQALAGKTPTTGASALPAAAGTSGNTPFMVVPAATTQTVTP